MKKEPTFEQLMTMLHLELEASIVEDLEVRLKKIMREENAQAEYKGYEQGLEAGKIIEEQRVRRAYCEVCHVFIDVSSGERTK